MTALKSPKVWSRIHIEKILNYQLDLKALETIYTSFIRPLLEYGDVLRDTCILSEKEQIDTSQYEAAIIVSGCTK